jgi:hypothetical protein
MAGTGINKIDSRPALESDKKLVRKRKKKKGGFLGVRST